MTRWWPIALWAGMGAGVARAADEPPSDLALKAGYASGTATEQLADGQQKVQYGGLRLALGLNHDLRTRLTAVVQADLLLDVPSKQLVSEGVEFGITFHVLGGARRLADEQERMSVVSSSTSNLSLTLRSGLFNFSAVNPADVAQRLSGVIFAVYAGAEYRHEISDRQALGLEALATVLTLPASTERLSVQEGVVMLSWRLYL